MGGGWYRESKLERAALKKLYKAEELKAQKILKKGRLTIATRIAERVIGKITNDIIRPGPKPEERECTVMAQELQDLKAQLIDTIFSALIKPQRKARSKNADTGG